MHDDSDYPLFDFDGVSLEDGNEADEPAKPEVVDASASVGSTFMQFCKA